MTDDPATSIVHRMPSDPLGIEFHGCSAGWIKIRIPVLTGNADVRCSHLDDPFPDLIEWLEAICRGDRVAMWLIDEEGASVRLIFADRGKSGGIGKDRLICIGDFGDPTDNDGPYAFSQAVTDGPALVRDFYHAFRAFVMSSDYQPKEWEFNIPEGKTYDELTAEEHDAAGEWSGTRLGKLTSPIIEAYLDERSSAAQAIG